jgi:hypothetical protein
MSLIARDGGEIEALVTDRYLDSLLADRLAVAPDTGPIDEAVRLVSRRLAGDLPRFHPSFRFEERLALRLAEAAASMRLPLAAGAERGASAIPSPLHPLAPDPLATPGDDELDDDRGDRSVLVGSAVAASLSLAGAAWLAWRRRGRPGSAMARAARAAHAGRGGHARVRA